MSGSFSQVIGTDPSDGMIEQAQTSTSRAEYPNVTFRKSAAESLAFLEDESVDLVVAGQAAHWFDQIKLWPEMKRILRKGGTVAFWGYKDHVYVEYPKATKILDECCYGDNALGPYWTQPGRFIVQNKLRDLQPPVSDWDDIQRTEYEPGTEGPRSGEGTMFLNKRMKLGESMAYVRTWSSFSAWQDKFQKKKRDDGGEGDIVDDVFEEMRSAEPDWRRDGEWKEKEVEIEWGSGLLLARRKYK